MFQTFITTYFGEIKDGELLRMQYFGYAVLAAVLIFVVMMLGVMSIGALEMFKGGDLIQAQAEIRRQLGVPVMIIFALIMIGYVFAQANVAAKRARDTGLPGWVFVAAVVIISALVGRFLNQGSGNAVSALAALWLLFAPSGMLKGGAS